MAFARRRRRQEGVLELTPLIDVIFLLLIFFMVSTSFVVNPSAIKLPESTSATSESNDQQLIMLVISRRFFNCRQFISRYKC